MYRFFVTDGLANGLVGFEIKNREAHKLSEASRLV